MGARCASRALRRATTVRAVRPLATAPWQLVGDTATEPATGMPSPHTFHRWLALSNRAEPPDDARLRQPGPSRGTSTL
jgi:hypothetical protein